MQELLTAKRLGRRVGAALVVLALVMLACSLVGTEKVSLKAVFAGSGQAVNTDYEIFVHVRLPRVILACVVGAALACAGVVFQALLRNPLADPYILGVSSGAGLGAIIAAICGFGWTWWGRSPMAAFAFGGAMGAVWLVWFVGRFTGKGNVTGLLLAGVVVNSFFSAVIMFLTSVVKSDQVYSTIFWLMGNMTEEDYVVLWVAGGLVLAGIGGLMSISSPLNLISFGEQEAQSMGVNTGRVRMAAFAVAAGMTAVAVSLSGLVGFVGLMVPHGMRLVFGPDHRQLLPLSAIMGAVVLVAADTAARVIVAPAQLPVGVITAMVGGPVFLVLLVKYARKIGWVSE